MTTVLHLDFETRSEINLKVRGLDVYATDLSTDALMCAYAFGDGPPSLWETRHWEFPEDLREALEDPDVEKWAFNARFERVIVKHVLDIDSPIQGWRCTMALAYMQGFFGALDQVGAQMSIPLDKQKDREGKRLLKMFTEPQKVTAKQPHRWRDETTDPEEWERFCEYCRQDVVAERAIKNRLIKYPIPEFEWRLWELDQKINDRGLPIDLQFVTNAIEMSNRRRGELTEELRDLTGLANPNSVQQLLPWLRDRGYPWHDLQKNTVTKALTEHEEGEHEIDEDCEQALLIRQQVARMAVKKYDAMVKGVSDDGRLRGAFQFAGASRTARWAGRRVQTQNMVRTPGVMEDNPWLLERMTEAVRRNDYDAVVVTYGEPMDVLAGLVRSAIRAPDENELRISDLNAIETRAAAWEANCKPLLDVLRSGKDPYKHLAAAIYKVPYEDVTKQQRQVGKPGVLGAVYRLSGGKLIEGKRTGLWGYAEAMGVKIAKELAHETVTTFRNLCGEIEAIWKTYENAFRAVMQHGRPVKVGPVMFEQRKPYLCIVLPSTRRIFYYMPRVTPVRVERGDGSTWTRYELSYMGKEQNRPSWGRIVTHGGKILENITQAVARDVLAEGLIAADAEGYDIIGHAHDEIITEQRHDDNYYTIDRLSEVMSRSLPWAEDLPLGAAGFSGQFYRKG